MRERSRRGRERDEERGKRETKAGGWRKSKHAMKEKEQKRRTE